jgi:peptidoglycan/LPS O-acetylase OafA/YrhL
MSEEKAVKIIWVEVLRFLSAMSIVVWHYQHFFYGDHGYEGFSANSQPFFDLLLFFYGFWGGGGVQLFWSISGYIFFWKYLDCISRVDEKQISAARFALFRFARLYPLHIVTFLFVALLQSLFAAQNGYFFVYSNNSLPQALSHLFMASNWFDAQPISFNGPIWSVSLEIVVYALFFISAMQFGRHRLYALAGFCFALFAYWISGVRVFQAASLFFAGGLVFFLHQHARKMFKLGLALVCLTVCYCLYKQGKMDNARLVFCPTILLLGEYLDVLCSHRKVKAVVSMLGNLTYASYLLHFPVQLTVAYVFSLLGKPIPVQSESFFLMYVWGNFILSYFVYAYFEMPANQYLRNHFIKPKTADTQRLIT